MKNDSSDSRPRPRWKQWLIERLDLSTQSRDELMEELHRINKKNILPDDAVNMMQGVVNFSSLQVQDVMIPRSQVQFIGHDDDFSTILKLIAETEHSRYPVVADNREDLIGILLAKDLLRYIGREDEFAIDDIVRPALIVPETQPLSRLLAEFRNNRAHMAVVIDEYAGIAGLVTFEDVLEQIVGDIDDEYDDEEDEDPNIIQQGGGRYLVSGITPIEELNELVGIELDDDAADTVAGLMINQLGKIPRPGEETTIGDLTLRVLLGDSRRIEQIEVLVGKQPHTTPVT
ncbi:MAG: transporter associated domain-containing protein [Thiofilum sp.]|uniref:transporter associated domain-containing protein n=1 Tax=Thiofilum sp. TaxID=2212733 RepID=UPI0025E6C8F5|nr:transporter associated domain-containing protein [Thiofilum sp.]MBK8454916.1 CBS domain-containing protein [Thiofilum sp.]